MARYARIADGLVAEIITLDGVDPADVFHPDVAQTIVPANDSSVIEGWFFHDGALAPPAQPAAPTPAELIAYAADLRWRKEVGGIIVAGLPVATDDRSKLMITGSRVAAMADPNWSTIWHGADGGTYPVDAAAMVAISDQVQSHVNRGFATFAAVKEAVEAGDIDSLAGIDAAFA